MLKTIQTKTASIAMSNAERQRQFRLRNPGYYQKLHAKRRAVIYALRDARREKQRALAELEQIKIPLALPAPAITFEFPGINTWPTRESIAAQREIQKVPVEYLDL